MDDIKYFDVVAKIAQNQGVTRDELVVVCQHHGVSYHGHGKHNPYLLKDEIEGRLFAVTTKLREAVEAMLILKNEVSFVQSALC